MVAGCHRWGSESSFPVLSDSSASNSARRASSRAELSEKEPMLLPATPPSPTSSRIASQLCFSLRDSMAPPGPGRIRPYDSMSGEIVRTCVTISAWNFGGISMETEGMKT